MLIMRVHRGVNMKCLGLEVNRTGTESLAIFFSISGISDSFKLYLSWWTIETLTEQDLLAHWPTVAWWASRLSLHGPACELCDLIFVPIGPEAGLEHVHPTWAGTFVLSALVFLFPGIHFVLLDSDCVPVTLFEVADLWRE